MTSGEGGSVELPHSSKTPAVKASEASIAAADNMLGTSVGLRQLEHIWNNELKCVYSRLRNNASGLIGVLPGPVFMQIFRHRNGSKKGTAEGGALLGPTSGPNPLAMGQKFGLKTGPGRTPIKPEALLRNREYVQTSGTSILPDGAETTAKP